MTFRFGSQTPTNLRVGTAAIQRIYEGSQIVWNGANPIPVENALAGVADSTVGYSTIGSGTDGFYGYAKQFSRNVGESIGFAVDGVNATNIAIHRIGHYGGLRWRLIATISNTPTNQPDTQVLPNSAGSRSAANWSTTATWNIPADAVSGLYVAVVRDAGNVARSWIPFIVREDGRTADIVLRVSDSTWGGAYNTFGTKAAPLDGKSVYGEGKGSSIFDINLRGVQMSYDRPIVSRGTTAGGSVVNHWDVHESALIDWIEKNGYNVKYISCYDLDQGLTAVGDAKILACAGHDEYWSDGMVNNTEAFIAAGGHHVSMSANSLFWRIRWADNGRTFWCYKDTMPGPTALRTGGAGTQLDPVSWTGTWRDTRWPQRRPENLLLGATFRMNGIRNETMVINGAANQAKPFWRNTTVAQGTNLTVNEVIGFEADSLDFPHSGGVDLGTTTININGSYADDNGQTYGNNGNLNWGIACHYPRPDTGSGLSIHFSTNQWMWGLSNYHRRGGAVINREMRQATYNMFTDLGAVAATKESDLTTVTPVALSTYGATLVDAVSVTVAPSSVLEDGTQNLVFTFTRTRTSGDLTVNYTIGGSAVNGTDYATIGTSVVIPNGSTTGTVTVNPTTDATVEGDETVTLTLASGTGYSFGVNRSATGTITNDETASSFTLTPESTVGSRNVDEAYQLGTRFFTSSSAFITGVRFMVDNAPISTGVSRTVTVFAHGAPLVSKTVAIPAGTQGYVTVPLDEPIPTFNTEEYTAAYFIPAGQPYFATPAFFAAPFVPGGANPLGAPINAGRFAPNPVDPDASIWPSNSFNNGFYHIEPVVTTAVASAERGLYKTDGANNELITRTFLATEGPYELAAGYTLTQSGILRRINCPIQTAETGSVTAKVWSSTGTLLATSNARSAPFGPSGSYAFTLPTPLSLTTGTTFWVSYNVNTHVLASTRNTGSFTPRNGINSTINGFRISTTSGVFPTTSAAGTVEYVVNPVIDFA